MRILVRILIALVFITLVALPVLYYWYVRGAGIEPRIVQSSRFRWEIQGAMPEARTEVAVAAFGGRIFVMGGFDGFGRTSHIVQVYDPATGAWGQGPSLLQAVHHAMAAAVGERLYLFGGLQGVRMMPTRRGFAFDGRRWEAVAPMPEPLGAAGIAVLNGRIHIVGGKGLRGDVRAHYVFDPARNRWERGAPVSTPRDHLAVAVLNGRLFAIAGRLEGKMSRNVGLVESYDPATKRWSVGPGLNYGRSGHTAVSYGGRVYAFGGEEPRGTIAPVEEFDGVRWRVVSRLPTPRHGLGAGLVDGRIYILSGGKRPGLSVSGTNEVLSVRSP